MSLPRGKRRLRLGLVLLPLALPVCIATVLITYLTVPNHNTNTKHFDTVIVLGCPADPDGSPSPEQRERVMTAVRDVEDGRAGAMIVSGGPTLQGRVEADAMARVAAEAGLPARLVIEERQAMNTLQNIFYSRAIMRQRGWQTAEVVSSPSHLPRASLIMEHWDIGWRVQAAHWPAVYDRERIAPYYVHEALGVTALRWFGFRPSPFLPS